MDRRERHQETGVQPELLEDQELSLRERFTQRAHEALERSREIGARVAIAGGLLLGAQHAIKEIRDIDPVSDLYNNPVISRVDDLFSIQEALADHEARHRNWAIRSGGRTVGWFYTETNAEFPEAPEWYGYPIRGLMWETFQRFGGVNVWGFPASQEFRDEIGRVAQVTQRGVFQLTVSGGRVQRVEWMNVFDLLKQRGIRSPFTPEYMLWGSDAGLPFGGSGLRPGTVERNHFDRVFDERISGVAQHRLDRLRRFYRSNPMWIEQYGLPMGVREFRDGSGNVVATVVVGQRAAIQLWEERNEIQIALGGDLAKKHLIPQEAVNPIPWRQVSGEAPAPQPPSAERPAPYFQDRTDSRRTGEGAIVNPDGSVVVAFPPLSDEVKGKVVMYDSRFPVFGGEWLVYAKVVSIDFGNRIVTIDRGPLGRLNVRFTDNAVVQMKLRNLVIGMDERDAFREGGNIADLEVGDWVLATDPDRSKVAAPAGSTVALHGVQIFQ